jgi:hypothetical protein
MSHETLDIEAIKILAMRYGISGSYSLYNVLTDAVDEYCATTTNKRLQHYKKACLEDIEKRASVLGDALARIDTELVSLLHKAWPDVPGKYEWPARVQADLRTLVQSANRAANEMPDPQCGGAIDAFDALFDKLIDMYEKGSGIGATYWHEEPEYRGAFVDFAIEALHLAGIDKTNMAVGKELERKLAARQIESKT